MPMEDDSISIDENQGLDDITILFNIVKDHFSPKITEVFHIHLTQMLKTRKKEHVEAHFLFLNQLVTQLQLQTNQQKKQSSAQGISTERLDLLINKLHNLQTSLLKLKEQKITDIKTWYGYMKFWSDEHWPGQNMVFLIVPLILSVADIFPPVRLATLIFTGIYTAVSVLDFGAQSEGYWGWSDPPPLNYRNDQPLDQDLNHDETHLLLHDTLTTENTPNRLNQFCYYGDIIAIAICVIAIISLAFPPVGIPVLALTILTGIAIFISTVQWGACWKRYLSDNKDLNDIESDRGKIDDFVQGLSEKSLLIKQDMVNDYTASRSPPHPRKTVSSAAKKATTTNSDKTDDDENRGNEPPHH